MDKLIVNGQRNISGKISVQGSKNGALPILSACVLTKSQVILHNCPKLSDVYAALKILNELGCKTDWQGNSLIVDSRDASAYSISDELMREMRSSIVFFGALIGRFGLAEFSTPGGCEIGLRPIDLHIKVMEALGTEIKNENGRISAKAPNGLSANNYVFQFPSVGATENAILAAAVARGTTVLENCAREPEIADLADFLNSCGAKIKGAGEGTIVIDGVGSLHGTEYSIIPDRIVAATLLTAGAMNGGNIVVDNIVPSHMRPLIPVFLEMGCNINVGESWMELKAPKRLGRVKHVVTMPYPGFPTDAQAPIMAATTIASGTSVFTENIFECRFKHVPELIRFGANIKVEGRMAVVEGVRRLYASSVAAPDLRGGASLLLAALAADGLSEISNVHHIDRGYENIENVLNQIGADVRRM
ncbi:MAG: UDP-N-acetylglucosamine 1-carboxyvinyltransferase [Oscillospiraceae bacterium]|nr:UDP-N-acetylglucosamine 1-carboxyvinyltransferase [Oscillospiraceae bacterium]